jgi:serine/threonine protein kinase
MEINEKCDVYSFGVLTLEILLGKHPGDIVSKLLQSSTVGQTIDAVLLTDMLDQRLLFPTNHIKKEVVSLIRIAFHCLAESPDTRPTMEQVCKEIAISKSSSSG